MEDGFGEQIATALRRAGWSQKDLARKAGVSDKTVYNALRGSDLTAEIISRLKKALQMSEVEMSDDYGAYTRQAFKAYEGYFFTYRRSYSNPDGGIWRSVIELKWRDGRLVFRDWYRTYDDDDKREDLYFAGDVHCSSRLNFIHFSTLTKGAARLMTLTQMDRNDIMRGVMLGQSEEIPTVYRITVSSVVLQKLATYDLKNLRTDFDKVPAGSQEYAFAARELAFAEEKIVKFSLMKEIVSA